MQHPARAPSSSLHTRPRALLDVTPGAHPHCSKSTPDCQGYGMQWEKKMPWTWGRGDVVISTSSRLTERGEAEVSRDGGELVVFSVPLVAGSWSRWFAKPKGCVVPSRDELLGPQGLGRGDAWTSDGDSPQHPQEDAWVPPGAPCRMQAGRIRADEAIDTQGCAEIMVFLS